MCDGLIRVRFPAKQDSLHDNQDKGSDPSVEGLTALQKKLQDSAHSSAGVEMSGILNIQRRLHIFSNDRDTLEISRSLLECLALQLFYQRDQLIIPAPFARIIS